LTKYFQIVPHNIGLCLEVARLPHPTPDQHPSNINASVDSVLRTIYQRRPDVSGNGRRRRIVFTSFSPDVCAAVNWKQPNCRFPLAFVYLQVGIRRLSLVASDPVFFGSLCGRQANVYPSPTALAQADVADERLSSLESAVRFSKANNLLGVFIEGDILVSTSSSMSHLSIPNSSLFGCSFSSIP
jgi:CDK inhibitor PHO81